MYLVFATKLQKYLGMRQERQALETFERDLLLRVGPVSPKL